MATTSGFVEEVELQGHIIDSLLLPKVLDEILTRGGSYVVRDIRVGQKRLRGPIGQPDEREDLEPAHSTPLGRPFEHRSVAPGDDEAQFRRQRRNQFVPQPGIGDAEHLIGVDEHDASASWLPARRVERSAKARLRRIDGRAVDPPDGSWRRQPAASPVS